MNFSRSPAGAGFPLSSNKLQDIVSATLSIHNHKSFLSMSKKIIATIAAVIVLLFSPIPSLALKGLKDTKIPDALNPELNYLLALIFSDNKEDWASGS
jgi:hypothetical protein